MGCCHSSLLASDFCLLSCTLQAFECLLYTTPQKKKKKKQRCCINIFSVLTARTKPCLYKSMLEEVIRMTESKWIYYLLLVLTFVWYFPS